MRRMAAAYGANKDVLSNSGGVYIAGVGAVKQRLADRTYSPFTGAAFQHFLRSSAGPPSELVPPTFR